MSFATKREELFSEAWVGDAYLRAFSRRYLLAKFPTAPRNRLSWIVEKCVTNSNMQAFCQRKKLVFSKPPRTKDYDALEARAGQLAADNQWSELRDLAIEICEDWLIRHPALIAFVERRELSWAQVMKSK